MELEWDEDKRQKVLLERDLDFADVTKFDPATIVIVPDMRRFYGEQRFNTYGALNGIPCTYCWTPRDSKTRIISMRKMNERERKVWLKAIKAASNNG
jgi:uncharacterized DUF497 family protein